MREDFLRTTWEVVAARTGALLMRAQKVCRVDPARLYSTSWGLCLDRAEVLDAGLHAQLQEDSWPYAEHQWQVRLWRVRSGIAGVARQEGWERETCLVREIVAGRGWWSGWGAQEQGRYEQVWLLPLER